jgi:hypothetical protein
MALNFLLVFFVVVVNCSFLFLVTRLEEKESDMKKEFTKLHERYTEVSSVTLTTSSMRSKESCIRALLQATLLGSLIIHRLLRNTL